MVFYECESVLPDGACDRRGLFVMIFGRSASKPSDEDMKMLRRVVRSVCLEMGDFINIPTEGMGTLYLTKGVVV